MRGEAHNRGAPGTSRSTIVGRICTPRTRPFRPNFRPAALNRPTDSLTHRRIKGRTIQSPDGDLNPFQPLSRGRAVEWHTLPKLFVHVAVVGFLASGEHGKQPCAHVGCLPRTADALCLLKTRTSRPTQPQASTSNDRWGDLKWSTFNSNEETAPSDFNACGGSRSKIARPRASRDRSSHLEGPTRRPRRSERGQMLIPPTWRTGRPKQTHGTARFHWRRPKVSSRFKPRTGSR